jgi:multiple sugar transport system substrate-binding protein
MIKVLLLDDYSSSGLLRLLVDFHARENIQVSIEKILPEKLFDFIKNNIQKEICDIDVFVFDAPWLHYLVQNKYLLCLDAFFDRYSFDKSKFLAKAFEALTEVDGHYYALPYMADTQLLFYRKDIFSDKGLCRDYNRRFKIPLSVPSNWLQYNTIAQFFTKKYNAESPFEYGHAMSLPYTEQILCDFLPRLWASGEALFDENGRPCFHKHKIKNVLRGMAESACYSYSSLFEDRPIDKVNRFINGEIPLVYTFFSYAAPMVDRLKSNVIGKLGFSSIPGHKPVLAGWSLGINPRTKHPDEAWRFLSWACGSDIAVPHAILGGQSTSLKVYENYDLISLYPWLPMALREFSASVKRELPVRFNKASFSEKDIEDTIAGELTAFLKKAVTAGSFDNLLIDEVASSLDEKIVSLTHPPYTAAL